MYAYASPLQGSTASTDCVPAAFCRVADAQATVHTEAHGHSHAESEQNFWNIMYYECMTSSHPGCAARATSEGHSHEVSISSLKAKQLRKHVLGSITLLNSSQAVTF